MAASCWLIFHSWSGHMLSGRHDWSCTSFWSLLREPPIMGLRDLLLHIYVPWRLNGIQLRISPIDAPLLLSQCVISLVFRMTNVFDTSPTWIHSALHYRHRPPWFRFLPRIRAFLVILTQASFRLWSVAFCSFSSWSQRHRWKKLFFPSRDCRYQTCQSHLFASPSQDTLEHFPRCFILHTRCAC